MRGLIGETWRLLRSHFFAMLLVALVFLVPGQLALAFADEDNPDLGNAAFFALGFVAYPWVYGATIATLSRRSRSPLEPYARTVDRLLALVLANIVTLFAVLLGLLLLIVPGLLIAARLLAAFPSIVLEKRGPLAAIERSNDLIKGRTWPVLGALAIILLPTVVVGLPALAVTFFAESPWAIGLGNALLGALLNAPTAALAYAVYRQAQAS